jgi:hypothetical protein
MITGASILMVSEAHLSLLHPPETRGNGEKVAAADAPGEERGGSQHRDVSMCIVSQLHPLDRLHCLPPATSISN